jgi:hypothetical protein
MHIRKRFFKCLGYVFVVTALAVPATAQVEDALSAYTGRNATGYVQPLADAFGAELNDAFYRTAYIPKTGVRVSLEVLVMGVMFGDDDRTFNATTEQGFIPETTVSAPTIVGDGKAVIVNGQGGTSFAFPGGFNLNSFGLAVPQIRISSFKGTEAVVRYIAFNTGDAELGDLSLYGLGARHSISQYFEEDFPVDIAAGFLWQSFSVGENEAGNDLISTSAFTAGVQGSKRLPAGFATFEPYTGLSIDTFKMDVEYQADIDGSEADIDLDFERETSLHWTIGLSLNLVAAAIYGEYNVASQNSFSFGVAFGNLGY